MAQKTKATMPGRQCSTENKEQKQDTRPAAGGQSLTTPEITEADNLLKGKQSVKLRLVSPEISGTAALAQLECTALQHTPYLNRCWGCEPVARTLLLHTSLGVVQTSPLRSPVLVSSNIGYGTYTKNAGRTPDLAFAQPFGSIPCRRNSARANSFIQLPRLTPSRSAASLSCWRNSGVIRIWKVGDSPSPFGVLSRLIVDMYVRNPLAWTLLCTYVNTANIQKTTPRTVVAVPGRLTKPLYEVTTMAELQHTQTRPEFTWRFLSVSERYPTAKPLVIYVNASSEQEARDTMPGVNLIFAARLPFHVFQVMEVRHA
ncbi:Uncharacterised protein [Enterobacter hormaechei]|nr:Uncharacterised protein [Enterobacter hormaechei]